MRDPSSRDPSSRDPSSRDPSSRDPSRPQPARLGVLGWPVAHSRSPAMHNAALAAMGLPWRYQRLPVPPQLLAETVAALGPAGFIGANVTIPHKRGALALADTVSAAAREIGAANTLSFRADGTIAAENTDAPGLIAALPLPMGGRSAMVLGAGGSARAAVWALTRAGAKVAVWNRTASRADALARELGARAVGSPQPADLLLNCTSVGLRGMASETHALNQLDLTADQVGRYPYVVDLVYTDAGPTALVAAARLHGAAALDGIEVLVRQGALSLQIWTGLDPPLQIMRDAASRPPTNA